MVGKYIDPFSLDCVYIPLETGSTVTARVGDRMCYRSEVSPISIYMFVHYMLRCYVDCPVTYCHTMHSKFENVSA